MKAKTDLIEVVVGGKKMLVPKQSVVRQSDYEKKIKDIVRRKKAYKKVYG